MNKQILGVFDKFRAARRDFVQAIAEYATKADNVAQLMELDVLSLLRPLLLDTVPTIQQTAALSVSRLAKYSKQISQDIVDAHILPEIVAGMTSEDTHYKENSCSVIKAIAKHSADLSTKVIDADALPPLIKCLASSDDKVKEAASSAIGSISTHNGEVAKAAVEAGALPELLNSINENNIQLKRLSIATVGEIVKHNTDLAIHAIQAKAIPIIAPLLKSTDEKIRQRACCTLSQIAKHSVDCAELVIEGQIFPQVYSCLKDRDQCVRRNAAVLIYEVVKHTQEQAQLVIASGGGPALVQYLRPHTEPEPKHVILALGHIASFSSSLAMSLINEDAPSVILSEYVSSKSCEVREAAAWALGQLGKHTSEHASRLASFGTLPLLLEGVRDKSASPKMQQNSQEALKAMIEKCNEVEVLHPMISRANKEILTCLLSQISKLLPKNPKARAPFVASGGFQAVQAISAEPGSEIEQFISDIKNCYPDLAVRSYAPGYAEKLNEEIEAYKI